MGKYDEIKVSLTRESWGQIYETLTAMKESGPSALVRQRNDWALEDLIAGTPLEFRESLLEGRHGR